MEYLESVLISSGFCRVPSVSNKDFVVIHGVPGSGKSTIIRKLLAHSSSYTAYTAGIPDPLNLTGRRIKALSDFSERDTAAFKILDEYQVVEDLSNFNILFGEPNQHTDTRFEADFICQHSERFGTSTAALLNGLDFEITAEGEDIVAFGGIFSTDIEGTIVACEEPIYKILDAHRANYLRVCEARGLTFDTVTFITSSRTIPFDRRAQHYICLTRHRKKLLILNEWASYGACEL
ncbi:TGB1 [Garlic yellow stripe associated virus]|nr:TGB1 [Garlic yellow stripe associated virus]